jgi:RsiW-degrading membrane proteinase PrsW (M82 family)|tara:strand:- start:18 stop:698 length:681 start_codon:yes stop_codon:yes gene_type:complete
MNLFLLSITILPPILIVIIFATSDKFKEPNKEIFLVFISGILITIPAYLTNNFLLDLYLNYSFIGKGLAESFLSAAAVEEGLKFLILYFVVYRLREFNEPMDAIVYGVCASLGFAALENIYFVLNSETPIAVFVVRSLFPLVAHGIFGVTMGYFFMKYAFIHKSKSLFLSFLIPYLLHGFYNYFIGINYFVISLALVIISWFIGIRLFLKLRREQKLKRREYEKKI